MYFPTRRYLQISLRSLRYTLDRTAFDRETSMQCDPFLRQEWFLQYRWRIGCHIFLSYLNTEQVKLNLIHISLLVYLKYLPFIFIYLENRIIHSRKRPSRLIFNSVQKQSNCFEERFLVLKGSFSDYSFDMAKEVIAWRLQFWWILKIRHLLHGILSRKGQYSLGYMWVGIVCMDYQLSSCGPSLDSAIIDKCVKHGKGIILCFKLSAFKLFVDNMKI
jgi:hypothetical protein